MTISSDKIGKLLEQQLAVWPQAKDNFEALKNVRIKEFDVDGLLVRVQFNPARIASTGAKIDAKSLKERKCFLCGANRPPQQEGIEWGDGRYIVLINPFPIFPKHFTIPVTEHVDQLIETRIEDMMKLASELEGYTVFYNGPKCGASAPDHMHFQAGNTDFLPLIEKAENAELKTIAEDGDSVLALVDTFPLKFFVIDATDVESGGHLFRKLYNALSVPEGEKEPMMNILCYATPAGVRLIVIPRKRHRPSFYGNETDDQMLLSPGAVDMGCTFIVPVEKDFNRIDPDVVRKVFDELGLSQDEVENIANNITP